MKIFLIGIGGIGMQGLARLYLGRGDQVAGSDIQEFSEREELEQLGAQIMIGHHPNHINRSFDLVVYSSAIPSDNPELNKARALGLPLRKRSEALDELMRGKIGIAVSGTHGKTTTATMLAEILDRAALSPTVAIGAEVRSIRGCARWGEGPYMVVEACEFDRSFLDLSPKIAVITNIEPDHLDYYSRGFDEIQEAFGEFIKKLPSDGLVVVCGDDPVARAVVNRFRRTIFYGEGKENDFVVEMGPLLAGQNNFILRARDGSFSLRTFIPLPGVHLALDAAAAAIVAWQLKVLPSVIQTALENFRGTKRRFEVVLQDNDLTIIDDYGHHPTEIVKTLAAARRLYWGRRLLVIFQPHQFSRTRLLLPDFAKSFHHADLAIIAPIWAVRDQANEKKLITTEDLVRAINRESQNARYLGAFDRIIAFLRREIRPGDVVITLGAAETDKLAAKLTAVLPESLKKIS